MYLTCWTTILRELCVPGKLLLFRCHPPVVRQTFFSIVTPSLNDPHFLMRKASLESLCCCWTAVTKLILLCYQTAILFLFMCHCLDSRVNIQLKSFFNSFLNLWRTKNMTKSVCSNGFQSLKKKKKKSRCESTFWEFDSITVPRNLCLGIVIVEVAVVIYGDPLTNWFVFPWREKASLDCAVKQSSKCSSSLGAKRQAI